MEESVVSLTYGTALYEAAKDLGKEEEILIEIKQLALLVQAYEDFSEFLNSPAIMPKEKKEAVKKIMQPAFSQEMLNFVYVLIDKGRTSQIKKIAKRYIELYDKDRGIAEGKVFSVVKLTPEQRCHDFCRGTSNSKTAWIQVSSAASKFRSAGR